MEEIIKDVCSGLMGIGLKGLGIDSYIVSNRDTFSSYEVEAVKDYDQAFYVVYNGFTPSALGIPGAEPAIRFLSSIGGPHISSMSAVVTDVDLENPGALTTPQRVAFTFRIHFDDTSDFISEMRNIYVEASLNGTADVALMHLINQPSPYMLDGPVSWLSTDVRVFQLRPGERLHSSSSVFLEDPDTVADAPYNYIQNLLGELRSYGNADAPSFEALSSNELELSRTVDGERVLNFAVAKVRYRANSQDALDVRVFFRTFNTMVSDLSYTSDTNAMLQNYRRTTAGTIPLLGINEFFSGTGNQIASIPYFAERRVDTSSHSMTSQADTNNVQTLMHAGATEAHTYFGCWLDFNQADPQFPADVPSGSDGPFGVGRLPIPQIIRGIHQCLVAEVRFQPGTTDPISNGAKPASSDRLAQRNLAIVESDNPGGEATHQVQHTFLLKPSSAGKGEFRALDAVGHNRKMRHDELVFHWNDLPRDTIAHLYLPDWNVDQLMAIDSALRAGPEILLKVDAHTVSFKVSDISYIPIPGHNQAPMPGLLTLQLPPTVKTGETFTVDVQHHTGNSFYTQADRQRKVQAVNLSRRQVLGGFQVNVAVKSGEKLHKKLVRNLAVLRYTFEAMAATDPWYPVFQRYLSQLGEQITGLGIDASLVPASLDDPGLPGETDLFTPGKITGKVREVFFDCFGDFKGFQLETCSSSHYIPSNERGIEDIVLRACRKRCTLTICFNKSGRLHQIIIGC
jgi:hypothetical protein